MTKNFGKAVWMGVLLYAVMFLIASVVMFVWSKDAIGWWMIIVAPIMTAIFTMWYSKSGTVGEGFMLGVVWLAIMALLDIAILIYALGNSWSGYYEWMTWVGYAETLLVPALVYSLRARPRIA